MTPRKLLAVLVTLWVLRSQIGEYGPGGGHPLIQLTILSGAETQNKTLLNNIRNNINKNTIAAILTLSQLEGGGDEKGSFINSDDSETVVIKKNESVAEESESTNLRRNETVVIKKNELAAATEESESNLRGSYQQQQTENETKITTKNSSSSTTTTTAAAAATPPSKPSSSSDGASNHTSSSTKKGNNSNHDHHKWRPTAEWVQQCIKDVTKNETIMQPFQSLTRTYVLGDCVKMCDRCHIEGRNKSARKNQHMIGKIYEKKACPQKHEKYKLGGNLDVVLESIEDWKTGKPKKLSTPEDDTVVIHLRMGDVLENSRDGVEKMLLEGGDPAHKGPFRNAIKPISEYLDNFQSILDEGGSVTKVVMVGGGFGKKEIFKVSRQYSTCLMRGFQKAGYEVDASLDSTDADADFYYMIHATKFIPTVGGFSQLIGNMVRKLGGQVVGRSFVGILPPKSNKKKKGKNQK